MSVERSGADGSAPGLLSLLAGLALSRSGTAQEIVVWLADVLGPVGEVLALWLRVAG